MYAQKTRIVFQNRVRFAGAVVKKTWLDAGIWIRRPVEHPRLIRTEDFGRLGYVHHFRIERPADIDDALEKLMREAYESGPAVVVLWARKDLRLHTPRAERPAALVRSHFSRAMRKRVSFVAPRARMPTSTRVSSDWR